MQGANEDIFADLGLPDAQEQYVKAQLVFHHRMGMGIAHPSGLQGFGRCLDLREWLVLRG